MTEYALAAVALATMSLIIAGVSALVREHRRLQLAADEWQPDELVISLAHHFTDVEPDDGSTGDPTWWMRARSYGHDPDLPAAARRAVAPMFEHFDRLMTDAFNRLDLIGA